MSNKLEERLIFLEQSRHSHYNIVQAMNPSQGFTSLDLFIWSVLKRSVSLVYGFTTLIREQNLVCAAPLIRLQIDNLLRYRAAFMVDDQDEFVLKVWSGTPIRKIKDRNGNVMTDAHLKQEMSKDFVGLREVYGKTSGYIHLSEEHFFNTIRASAKGEGRIEIFVGPKDQFVTRQVYEESTETMISVTNSLLTDLADWVKKRRSV
jgi:hypothetical protein